MATIITNFANLLRDMGTSAALIQRENLSGELIDTVFWSNIGFGFVLMVLVAGGSPVAALAFREPRLTGVLLALALVFPIASAGAPHLALLEREGRFRVLATLEIISAALGLSAALLAALSGLGVYSLVLQTIVGATFSTAQLWIASSWRPRFRWHHHEFRGIRKFSGNIVAFSVINYFVRNGDTILIGRFLSVAELGWYSIAMRFLLFPVQSFAWLLNRALLPIYSRQQSDPARLAATYLRTLTMIAGCSAPLMFGLTALRTPFVETILGGKWLAVAPLLLWLAPTGFLQSLGSTTGSVLIARGRTDLMRRFGVLNSVVVVVGFLVGVHFGILGVAKAYFITTIFTTFVWLHVTLSEIGSNLMVLARNIVPPIALATIMASWVAACEQITVRAFGPGVPVLAILSLMGVIIYVAEIRLLRPALFYEFVAVLSRQRRSTVQ